MVASASIPALAFPSRAFAETSYPPGKWPNKPMRLIVPNVPGGGTDTLARLLERHLAKIWQQPLLVEYKPGAGTMIGTDYVAKSPPDGSTLGMVVTSHVINPALRRNMPFDTQKDLAGVMLTARSSLLLSVASGMPVHSLAELLAYSRANSGRLSYATPGAGSSMHLAGELLKLTSGLDMAHVPYKGSGAAYGDVFENRVNVLIDPLFSSLPHVTAGRLRPIAVLSARRDAIAPRIAAIGETYAGFDVQSINGIVVPAATPRELVKRLNADFAAVLKNDEVVKRLAEIGLEPVASSPESFDAYVKSEMQRWQAVVKAGNITID
ncbi:tripartite tricarboxylate transporter substrate binding protein [Ideonella azotifigens]|uniref:Tripartite tricarboxylate transporter substrate binding protein n=1 Tax=Ideonella azotifigens TaxID=513160 RepID=A0ABN1JV89_9BURK|nr:tripartite tricarboxylate transporter substrate binding protein [Ideonella azotifigens]MCD2341170.1 tripartite tricarboxylate transporter substrate binding protein [Ideonella azotifigens]